MSPASAWALSSWSRSPTRSISLAIWRPFKVCRGRRQRKFFFAALLESCDGPMSTPSRFLISAMRRGIVQFRRLATGACKQRHAHPQRGLSLHRRRACIYAGLDRLDATAREIATPQPHRVLTHTEHLGNPHAGPAIERQQYGARPIGLAAIARNRQSFQPTALLITRLHRRFACHVPLPRISAKTQTQPRFVGQVRRVCLGREIPWDGAVQAIDREDGRWRFCSGSCAAAPRWL